MPTTPANELDLRLAIDRIPLRLADKAKAAVEARFPGTAVEVDRRRVTAGQVTVYVTGLVTYADRSAAIDVADVAVGRR
jgi:hypothetical protein